MTYPLPSAHKLRLSIHSSWSRLGNCPSWTGTAQYGAEQYDMTVIGTAWKNTARNRMIKEAKKHWGLCRYAMPIYSDGCSSSNAIFLA